MQWLVINATCVTRAHTDATDLQFDFPVRELSSLFFLSHLTAVESPLCEVRFILCIGELYCFMSLG